MTEGRCYWNYYGPGRLVFGSGAIQHVANVLEPFRPKKIMLIADPHLDQVGIIAKVITPLSEAGYSLHVCLDGEPEPSFKTAERVLAAARHYKPNLILAVGGGSNMDLGKVTAVVTTHGGNIRDYLQHDKVPGPLMPLVCVPTTAGTGSEVSHAAVLTDHEQNTKVSTLSQYMRPAVALVDPTLTLSCSPKVTADSGIDALTHAIEAYTCVDHDKLAVPITEPFPYGGKQPLVDVLAERAIKLIARNLRAAVQQPELLPAREGMSLAATLAGLAFSNAAVAVVHALEYPLGALVHVSHGAGNGLLLPHVMRYNLSTRPREFARIAAFMGEQVAGQTYESAAEKAVTAVEKLCRDVGIPQRLRDLGVQREQLPSLAHRAFQITRLMLLNPRQPTEQDLLEILEAAY
ncbi:MAG: alcohol dehydrogenase [Planctomycetaceae bacterium]|nr:MAG: alcohol dehydrogenase [Planctomycetaceae bacterium]